MCERSCRLCLRRPPGGSVAEVSSRCVSRSESRALLGIARARMCFSMWVLPRFTLPAGKQADWPIIVARAPSPKPPGLSRLDGGSGPPLCRERQLAPYPLLSKRGALRLVLLCRNSVYKQISGTKHLASHRHPADTAKRPELPESLVLKCRQPASHPTVGPPEEGPGFPQPASVSTCT